MKAKWERNIPPFTPTGISKTFPHQKNCKQSNYLISVKKPEITRYEYCNGGGLWGITGKGVGRHERTIGRKYFKQFTKEKPELTTLITYTHKVVEKQRYSCFEGNNLVIFKKYRSPEANKFPHFLSPSRPFIGINTHYKSLDGCLIRREILVQGKEKDKEPRGYRVR